MNVAYVEKYINQEPASKSLRIYYFRFIIEIYFKSIIS